MIILSLSRRDIAEWAQPFEFTEASSLEQRHNTRTRWLPLGLRNRQRIWMCLEFLDISGGSGIIEMDKEEITEEDKEGITEVD